MIAALRQKDEEDHGEDSASITTVSLNFHIYVSVSNLYIPIHILLQQNRQTDPGII